MHGRLRRGLFPYCSIGIHSGSKYKISALLNCTHDYLICRRLNMFQLQALISASNSSIANWVPKPIQDELDDPYRQLERTGRKPVLLFILPRYCDKEEFSHGPTLSTLFKDDFLQLSHPELLKKCEESFFIYYSWTTVHETSCENHKDPSSFKSWFQY